jgi:hypothetical protein
MKTTNLCPSGTVLCGKCKKGVFQFSDMPTDRAWFAPCPHCGTYYIIEFGEYHAILKPLGEGIPKPEEKGECESYEQKIGRLTLEAVMAYYPKEEIEKANQGGDIGATRLEKCPPSSPSGRPSEIQVVSQGEGYKIPRFGDPEEERTFRRELLDVVEKHFVKELDDSGIIGIRDFERLRKKFL